MVPMAPSKMRMRLAAAFEKAAMRSLRFMELSSGHRGQGSGSRFRGPYPEQMADGVNKIGAVQRVKVKLCAAAGRQIEDLLGGNCGGDELGRFRIVAKAVETMGERCR